MQFSGIRRTTIYPYERANGERSSPNSMANATRTNTVKTKSPMPQMPSVTQSSTQLGAYSTNSPKGEVIKPGTISPRPFYIQMAIKSITHATPKKAGRRRSG